VVLVQRSVVQAVRVVERSIHQENAVSKWLLIGIIIALWAATIAIALTWR
jgi:hypothetical protein